MSEIKEAIRCGTCNGLLAPYYWQVPTSLYCPYCASQGIQPGGLLK